MLGEFESKTRLGCYIIARCGAIYTDNVYTLLIDLIALEASRFFYNFFSFNLFIFFHFLCYWFDFRFLDLLNLSLLPAELKFFLKFLFLVESLLFF